VKDTIEMMQHALDALLDEGFALFTGAMHGNHGDHPLTFIKKHATYQSWYTKALRVVRQLYPELSDDFQAHYRAILSTRSLTPYPTWYRKVLRVMHKLTPQRDDDAPDPSQGRQDDKPVASYATKTSVGMEILQNGETIASGRITFLTRLSHQLRMLNSVRNGLEYMLADLQSTLYGEVGNHILATAYALFHRGQHRAAGALAGVLLEIHLAKVATKYRSPTAPTSSGLATLNTALKRGGIYDVEVWRFIDSLGALGHACVYAPAYEPTVDDLTEFLHGVQLIRKRVR
jgi:hypothetical protein